MRRALLALAAIGALAACSSPEEKLLDRRQELRETLDELHARYASDAPAGERPAAEPGAAEGGGGLVQRLVGEIDRAHFDQVCLGTGRGERVFSFSGRLEAFVREERNARACREAARLEAEVAGLEREVAARRAREPR